MKISKRLVLFVLLIISIKSYSQIDPFTVDTTWVKDISLLKDKYKNLSFSGYLQTQYQWAQKKGIESFNGGDFKEKVDNRFMIRRGRLRADYLVADNKGNKKYYFALQFDGTERGVNIRDLFGRIYENKWNLFVATVGMFNRPFGYELQNSSSQRESPERGRMSQILMKNERDLGIMISFQPQDKKNKLHFLQIDLGVFNGQGLASTADYDSYKDVIGRVSVNNLNILKNKVKITGGISFLSGGIGSDSDYSYKTKTISGIKQMVLNSNENNKNIKHDRQYFGADLALKYPLNEGYFEARAEYIIGKQTALFNNTSTPTELPTQPVYTRNFDGAYFYLIYNFLKNHQIILKYDWYDPNTKVSAKQINEINGFSKADIRYDTFGFGYTYLFNTQLKLMLYYDIPINEKTLIEGYEKDIKDNTFTARVQFRF